MSQIKLSHVHLDDAIKAANHNFDELYGASGLADPNPIAAGGTGQTTAAAALAALAGPLARTSADALTASTTQTLVGGLALTKGINVLTTVANTGDSVTLPTMAVGDEVIVDNQGAYNAWVYPFGSGVAIDAGSAGAKVVLTAGARCLYVYTAANQVRSYLLGATSA